MDAVYAFILILGIIGTGLVGYAVLFMDFDETPQRKSADVAKERLVTTIRNTNTRRN